MMLISCLWATFCADYVLATAEEENLVDSISAESTDKNKLLALKTYLKIFPSLKISTATALNVIKTLEDEDDVSKGCALRKLIPYLRHDQVVHGNHVTRLFSHENDGAEAVKALSKKVNIIDTDQSSRLHRNDKDKIIRSNTYDRVFEDNSWSWQPEFLYTQGDKHYHVINGQCYQGKCCIYFPKLNNYMYISEDKSVISKHPPNANHSPFLTNASEDLLSDVVI